MQADEVIASKFREYADQNVWVCVKGKAPVAPGTDTPLKWRDPVNRMTWDKAQMIPGDHGIILDGTGLTCLDFDDVFVDKRVDPSKAYVITILQDLDTWVEISSSGTGLHAWLRVIGGIKNDKKNLGLIEIIADGHVKVTGNSYPPFADKEIRTWDTTRLQDLIERSILKNKPAKVPELGKATGRDRRVVPQGDRNNSLTSFAGKLRKRGYEEPEILAAAIAENNGYKPPLPPEEVATIAHSISGYPAGMDQVWAIPPPSAEARGIAGGVMKAGEFIKYCTEAFGKIWLGDQHILEGVLYTAANMRVINAMDAIHIHISGSTQTGKSDGVKAALKFIHPYDYLTATFTPKWIFHAADAGHLHEGMIVFSDDTTLDLEVAAIYRNMLTSWHTGVERGCVINMKTEMLHTPPRISLILTSIDSVVAQSEEGQDESRYLTLEVRRTPDQMMGIRKFIQEGKKDISKEIEVVRALWDLITPQEITRHKIVERDLPVREFRRFLTLIQARALLHGRTTTTDEDYDAIEKFLTYSKPMINSTTAAFTRSEAAVRSILTKDPKTIPDIVEETGLSIYRVYRAIRGAKGNFTTPGGGLMEKEPNLIHVIVKDEFVNDKHTFCMRGVK
jgi:hypothetical protein